MATALPPAMYLPPPATCHERYRLTDVTASSTDPSLSTICVPVAPDRIQTCAPDTCKRDLRWTYASVCVRGCTPHHVSHIATSPINQSVCASIHYRCAECAASQNAYTAASLECARELSTPSTRLHACSSGSRPQNIVRVERRARRPTPPCQNSYQQPLRPPCPRRCQRRIGDQPGALAS